MSYETADILDSAADEILREGWWQFGVPSDHLGDHATCAGNAILHQSRGNAEALKAAQSALWQRLGGSDLPDIWAWNDAPERTQQEVLDALRGAAKAERRAADEVSA